MQNLRTQAPPLPGNAFAHLSAPQAPLVPASIVASPLSADTPSPLVSPSPLAPLNPSSIPISASPYPATGQVAAPAFPVGVDYPLSQPEAQFGSTPALTQNVSPETYNPWAAPVQTGPSSDAVSPFPATDTTQGLVLEERAVVPSRLSKGEVAFWALAVLLAGSVIGHRNGVLHQWFGAGSHSAYSLFETQVLGKPSLDTVAGVRAYLSEVAPSAAATSTTGR